MGETGDPRRGWAGMPRAEARLLAMEDVSRLGIRALPANLGGRCASWAEAALFVFPASAATGWFARVEGEVSLGIAAGCSCWNLRISASFLWCVSSRRNVRRAFGNTSAYGVTLEGGGR